MKSLIFLILAVVALAQAKYPMSPNSISAAMERNEISDEPLTHVAMLTEILYIPMAHHVSCNKAGCEAICQALGYKHGRCVSDWTCQCYN